MLRKIFSHVNVGAIKNFLLVVVGTVILAFSTAIFLVPFNLVSGGISGLAIVFDHIMPWEFITVDLLITVMTWVLFFVGLFSLGRTFAMKTLVSTVIYPVAYSAFAHLVSPDVASGYFYMASSNYGETALIIAATVGGALVGIGCAIAFLGGGSTGGVDIIAFIICKISPRAKSSVVMFVIDALIVLAGVFAIKDMVISILGIVTAMITALFVDKVFLGGSRSFVAHVVTTDHVEICRRVIKQLDRTATVVDVIGAYSNSPKKMLMISFTMREYAELIAIISAVDDKAFITVNKAHEISGEGWTRGKSEPQE